MAKSKKTKPTDRHQKVVRRSLRANNGVKKTSRARGGPTLKSLKAELRQNPEDWNVRLRYAETLLDRGKADTAIALIDEQFVPALRDVSEDTFLSASHVLALACASADRFDRARQVALDAVDIEPGALDLHYILAYAAVRLRNHETALGAADAFLRLVCNPPETDRQTRFRRTRDRVYEAWNYKGAALQGLERHDEAIACFAEATDRRPDYEVAWRNWLASLKELGRDEDFVDVRLRAREQCPSSPHFGKVRRAKELATAGALVSLCMIVKDEEEFLAQCLENAGPLCDEIIVVDTGSSDRTVEIAESFGAKVYHHAWENDFSKARNISIGYATGDWVLILDADEQLQPQHLNDLRETLRTTDFNLISITVYNYSREQATYTSFLPSVRLFRREREFRYDGIVHNQLKFPPEEGILRVPVSLIHYGYGLEPEAMARKIARSKVLLREQLDSNPDHGFAHFNLAQLLRGEETEPTEESSREVLHHAQRAVELCSPDDPVVRHIHLMALHQVVTAHFNLGEYQQAEATCHRALGLKPNYLDPIISLGHIHSMTGETEKARRYFLEYLDRQQQFAEHEETDQIILLHLRSRHNALYGLGLVAGMEENWREAIDWFERCSVERADYIDTHYQMGIAYRALGELVRARECFERQLAIDVDHLDARIKLGAILFDVADYTAARDELAEAAGRDPEHATIRYMQAKVLDKLGDTVGAIAHMDAVVSRQPGWIHAQRFRADLLLDNGDTEAAQKAYEWLIEQGTDDCHARLNLGNCHFKSGRFDEAVAAYSAVLVSEPGHAMALRNWALALHRLGRTDEATEAFGTYCERHTDDLDALEAYGDLLFGQQHYARARDCYERVLGGCPDAVNVLLRIGDCYFNLGALDAALLGYGQILKTHPGNELAQERVRAIEEYQHRAEAVPS